MAKNLFLTSVAQILFANQGWKLSNQTILLASPMPVCTFVEEPLALRGKQSSNSFSFTVYMLGQ